MYINVSDEAIQQEQALRSQVRALHKDLLQGAKALITSFNDNQAGLGAHDQTIYQLLEELATESGDASSVKRLSAVLGKSAEIRQAHRDSNSYSGKSR